MAVSHGSSLHKTEVYESLYLICQATQQITEHLERLRSANVLVSSFVEINKTAALELRAEITTSALHNLTAPEVEETHRHETKRIRMERKLAQTGPGTGPLKK